MWCGYLVGGGVVEGLMFDDLIQFVESREGGTVVMVHSVDIPT